MLNSEKIRVILLYEFKLEHKASEATRNINKAFGEGTVNERTAQRWFEKFRSGNFDLENEPRGRPPTVVNRDDLKALVEANPSTNVRAIGAELGVCATTVSKHLAAVGKTKKLQTFVPHELTEGQKLRRTEICSSLLIRNENDPFLERIVTCDEKWILHDNRKRSGQWLDIDQQPTQAPKQPLHPRKIMVTVWWTAKGIVHYSFLQPGETITANKYCQEIEIMHQKLRKKQPALVNRSGPIILHDNARPHVSQLTVNKLSQLGYEILSHPPYSPDLSPTDYHLFRSLEHFIRNKRYENEDAVKSAFADFVHSKNHDFFKSGIYALPSRWKRCVDAAGSYFD